MQTPLVPLLPIAGPSGTPRAPSGVHISGRRALARTSIDQSLCFYDQEMLEHIGWGARLLRYDPTDPLNIGIDEHPDPE